MPLFTLTCLDKPGALDLRLATREAHLAYIQDHRSLVKVAGPLQDAEGGMVGSHFILETATRAEAEAFAAGDPYGVAGLFQSVVIRPWKLTIGGFA